MSDTAALRRPEPVVLGDFISATRTQDVLLVVGAAAFVGALAQVSVHLSFTPVPITGQTLGVLVAGAALGWKRASAAMALYALAGIGGVPWFADHTSGYPWRELRLRRGFRAVRGAMWVPRRTGRRPDAFEIGARHGGR